VSFDPLSAEQAEAFLQKRARDNGIPLDTAAASLLVLYLGVDLGALENTLLMLGAYVGFGNRVNRKAVETCVNPSAEYKVFTILDDLWAGNKKKGIAELAGLVSSPTESAMGLATLFERNVRVVVNAKQLLLGGKTEAQIAEILGVKPFVAQKAVRNAKKRTLKQLNGALDAFISIDWKQKQGLAKAEDAWYWPAVRIFEYHNKENIEYDQAHRLYEIENPRAVAGCQRDAARALRTRFRRSLP
jgi:DNA polymerase III delta subunit